MKKLIALYMVLLCSSFLYAQSSNPKFIDSPSWVLAGEGSQRGDRPTEIRPTVAPVRLPAASGSEYDGNATKEKVAPQEAHSGGQAAGKASGRSSVNEGFFHIGVYVAPVINWISSISEPYDRTGSNFSVTPTVMFDLRLFRRFYFGVGASFNTLGGKVAYPSLTFPSLSETGGDNQVKHNRSYSFSYVEIPLRVKIQTRNFSESNGSLFFSAGANVGFGVRYKYKDTYTGVPILTGDMGLQKGTFEMEGKMKNDSKLANLSAVGQIGFNYQIARRVNLIIGVEYHYGFIRPLKKESNNQLSSWPKFNNQQVGLLLGVMF